MLKLTRREPNVLPYNSRVSSWVRMLGKTDNSSRCVLVSFKEILFYFFFIPLQSQWTCHYGHLFTSPAASASIESKSLTRNGETTVFWSALLSNTLCTNKINLNQKNWNTKQTLYRESSLKFTLVNAQSNSSCLEPRYGLKSSSNTSDITLLTGSAEFCCFWAFASLLGDNDGGFAWNSLSMSTSESALQYTTNENTKKNVGIIWLCSFFFRNKWFLTRTKYNEYAVHFVISGSYGKQMNTYNIYMIEVNF